MIVKISGTLLSKELDRVEIMTGGGVGYEIFDKSDALGTTSFVQNINHLRALEGELARTIRAIDRIQAARVHLVLPERPAGTESLGEEALAALKSPDAAVNWRPVSNGFGERVLLHLAIDPGEPDRMFAVTEESRILRSTDGGKSWQPLLS